VNIIVAGMGVVGLHIASVLSADNLTLIDTSADSLEKAGDEIDAMTIHGSAVSERTLRQAGVEQCDLFIAVTDMDEVNIIAAVRAKHLGAKKAIARVTDRVYFEGEHGLYTDMFGIDLVINPKFLVALEIHKLIRTRGAVAVEDFANNQIEMVQLPIEKATKGTNRPLQDVKMPDNVRIAGIVRHGELLIPHGGDQIRVGDDVLCIGKIDDIPKVEHLFGRERHRDTRYVIVVGGGDIGLALARYLEADNVDVRIIEKDRDRCERLQEELTGRHTEVLHGDGTNAHLLQELSIPTCDVFVAVSQKDEVNLMASLLAKEMRAQSCISLVHRPDFTQILKRLGIDSTLSPRVLVAREVLKHVGATDVLQVASIMDGQGEFMEFVVSKDARIANRPLKDVNFPRGAMVCAVFGDGQAFIARGDTVFEPGQRVVVITKPKVRKAVERLF